MIWPQIRFLLKVSLKGLKKVFSLTLWCHRYPVSSSALVCHVQRNVNVWDYLVESRLTTKKMSFHKSASLLNQLNWILHSSERFCSCSAHSSVQLSAVTAPFKHWQARLPESLSDAAMRHCLYGRGLLFEFSWGSLCLACPSISWLELQREGQRVCSIYRTKGCPIVRPDLMR